MSRTALGALAPLFHVDGRQAAAPAGLRTAAAGDAAPLIEPFVEAGRCSPITVARLPGPPAVLGNANAELTALYADVRDAPDDPIGWVRTLEAAWLPLDRDRRKALHCDPRARH